MCLMWPLQVRLVATLVPSLLPSDEPRKEEEVGEELLMPMQALSRLLHHFPMQLPRGKVAEP